MLTMFNLVVDVFVGILVLAGLVWRGRHPYLNGALAVIFAASMGMRLLGSGESIAFSAAVAVWTFLFWLMLWFDTSDRMAEPVNHSIFLEGLVLTIPIASFGSLSWLAFESWKLSHAGIFLFVAIVLGLGFFCSVLYEYHIVTILRRRLRRS